LLCSSEHPLKGSGSGRTSDGDGRLSGSSDHGSRSDGSVSVSSGRVGEGSELGGELGKVREEFIGTRSGFSNVSGLVHGASDFGHSFDESFLDGALLGAVR